MHYWSWGGKYIGKRTGNYLYSASGKPLGVFYDNELYDSYGKYIGETRQDNRIIVNKNHKNKCKPSKSIPCGSSGSNLSNIGGYAMLAGYEDFTFHYV